MAQPLAGTRVLDLTRVMTGPFCSMMLGDMGADVIKVEQPGKGDDTRAWGPPFMEGESAYYLSANRNKRSITVDLKHERGKEVVRRLARTADVAIENFSPGTAGRLGLAYDDLRAIKPDLIYCSISGFGQDGPGHRRTAYDIIIQGMSGMMSITGEPDGMPMKMGVPIADMTGGMFAAYAIVNAILHRKDTGEGQHIDTSLYGSQVALLVHYAVGYFATGVVPHRQGNQHNTVVPYGTFATADGYVNLAIGNDSLWQRFCQAFGLDEAAADPRFATNAARKAHMPPLYEVMNGALARYATAEVLAKLDALGVPAGPINTIDGVFADPQTLHLGLEQRVEHPVIPELRVPGFPYRLSGTPCEVRLPPPLLGEHTDAVLAEIGYDAREIAGLREAGAV
ncbi:MAG: CoA transferase [Chloroflexota bacterium]|nr:CoA transferase [Chloroflexota bacterium]